jgi:bile-acid 7alpha-dehydratase
MTELMELERRIRALEDIEAIKNLKAKYWRAIDTKQWDELAETLADGVVADLGVIKPADKSAYVQFMKDTVDRGSIVGIHQGHNPEIEITSDMTAKGTWELYNHLVDLETNKPLIFTALYHDEYAKEDGQWKIKVTKVTPIFMT